MFINCWPYQRLEHADEPQFGTLSRRGFELCWFLRVVLRQYHFDASNVRVKIEFKRPAVHPFFSGFQRLIHINIEFTAGDVRAIFRIL